MEKNDPVEVIWRDVVQDPAWQSEEKASIVGPMTCRSLGYYLNTDKQYLRISETVNEEDGSRSVQVIPRSLIVKIRKLR
jgi:hypothetical protein